MKILWDFYFADWRLFEVCGNKFLWRELGLKFLLGTKFCGFLFKQQDYFQLLLLFDKKTSQSSRRWKKCGILDSLENGFSIDCFECVSHACETGKVLS